MGRLELKSVVKRFGAHDVIRHVDLAVNDGEFVVFVGPSGCGKSTLLRMIAGLEGITSGEVLIDDEVVNEVPAARRGLAMVFQSYALYPHMTVRKNLSFGLRTIGTPTAEIRRRVAEVAATLQIEALLERKPSQLSGGQQQRVAIGRAIVREPKIFLFDEPLSNLDAELRMQMRVEINKLHRRLGATMIFVTHDQIEAMTLADRIVVLRAGVIEQVGTPLELYNHPVNQFVAGFLGSPKMNFLKVGSSATGPDEVAVRGPAGITLSLTGRGTAPAAATSLGVRPEHIRLVPAGSGVVDATVQIAEQLGGSTYLHTTLASGDAVVVEVNGQIEAGLGAIIGLDFDLATVHLFDQQGMTVGTPVPATPAAVA